MLLSRRSWRFRVGASTDPSKPNVARPEAHAREGASARDFRQRGAMPWIEPDPAGAEGVGPKAPRGRACVRRAFSRGRDRGRGFPTASVRRRRSLEEVRFVQGLGKPRLPSSGRGEGPVARFRPYGAGPYERLPWRRSSGSPSCMHFAWSTPAAERRGRSGHLALRPCVGGEKAAGRGGSAADEACPRRFGEMEWMGATPAREAVARSKGDPETVVRLSTGRKTAVFCGPSNATAKAAKKVEEFARGELTVLGEVLINRINDGGTAAGDEILRPLVLRVALKKGLANGTEKVLKVDSFGRPKGRSKPSEG